MGRYSRRFGVRLTGVIGACAVGYAASSRLAYRSGATHLLPDVLAPTTRDERIHALRSQTSSNSSSSSSSGSKGADRSAPVPLFDVVVVGGGLVGLYTALDAQQRGLSVAVLEAEDFGSGSTFTAPPLLPGAFAFMQRALRQRDLGWLWHGVEAMRSITTWTMVAPNCCSVSAESVFLGLTAGAGAEYHQTSQQPPALSESPRTTTTTLVPALHVTELVEMYTAGFLGTVLSPLCGPLRWTRYTGSRSMQSSLTSSTGEKVRGGVVVQDGHLDSAAAAVCLARTAEALGATVLNYAAVQRCESARFASVTDSGVRAGKPQWAVEVVGVDTANEAVGDGMLVTFTDKNAELDGEKVVSHRIGAKCVVNSCGAWTDRVRTDVFGSAETRSTVEMVSRYQTNTYLVVKADDVTLRNEGDSGNALPWSVLPGGARGLVVFSTLRSFASSSVIPWFNNTLLVGMCSQPIESGPATKHNADGLQGRSYKGNPGTNARANVTLFSPDHFASEQQHIRSILRSCGVYVRENAMATALSSVVPLMHSSTNAPWGPSLLHDGFYIDVDAAHRACHVYGGGALTARRIAEKVVDTLVEATSVRESRSSPWLPAAKLAHLKPCATDRLALVGGGRYSASNRHDDGAASSSSSSSESPFTHEIRSQVRDKYCVSVVDLIASRWKLAYTDPLRAVEALPALCELLGKELNWSDARKKQEVKRGAAFVRDIVAFQQ